jgi:peroxin-19
MLEKMAFGPDGGFGDGAGGDMGGLGDILPAMQGMLQSLLSKELLYPSIKEIVSKVSIHLRTDDSKSCLS